MKNYTIKNNKLIIEFEPFNDIEEFSEYCLLLLDSKEDMLEIDFSNKVFSLSSQFVGVLMMTIAGAKMKNKKITISCSRRLGRILTMVNGGKFQINMKDDLVDDSVYIM